MAKNMALMTGDPPPMKRKAFPAQYHLISITFEKDTILT